MISENNLSGSPNLIPSVYQVNPGIKNSYKIRKIKFALNQNQRKELLQIAEKQNFKHALMIKTQMGLGLRVSELCNMGISQLNLYNGFVLIQSRNATKYLKSFRVKTLSSNRRIPIPKELVRDIKNSIGNRKTGYVFQSNKHGSFLKNSVIGFINKYARQCLSIGYNIGSHSLRRTYASFLIKNGLPINDISKLLGHSSIRTTMKYLFEIDNLDYIEIKKITGKMFK
ncbi:tyrosine-type recombinase/integrase [Promethearchaeum syntrophicum]|uniref:Tyrosine-type recombinase/integrase n=1 Tax=Promethearchaeum syntrophicum TaxID=2594042 RepID=A0AC61ZU29_9ARCH